MADTTQANALGLELSTFDLAAPQADAAAREILAAFRDHPVLVFPGQTLTAPTLAAFARRFGRIVPGVNEKYRHPEAPEISFLTNVAADGTVDAFGVTRASAWHYDGSFADPSPHCAMLYALETPAEGGGTLFADMYRAYERLPPALKQRADGLETVNHFGLGPEGGDYYDDLTPERWGAYRPVRKPLVRRHPASGRPYLEFCMIHTAGFVGVRHAEGRALLTELLDRATAPDNLYYHRWRPGDVVLWDEHATLHRNAGDYPPNQRRIMLRAMVEPAAA